MRYTAKDRARLHRALDHVLAKDAIKRGPRGVVIPDDTQLAIIGLQQELLDEKDSARCAELRAEIARQKTFLTRRDLAKQKGA